MSNKVKEWLGNFTTGTIVGAAGTILASVLTVLWEKISPGTFEEFVNGFLKPIVTYQVPIWYAFAFIACWYFGDFLVRRYKPKKKVETDDVWKKNIGNFTFGDLCDIMMEKFISPSKVVGSTTENALVIFYHYAGELIKGIGPTTINDGGFAYEELAPYLAMHQLVDRRADNYYHLNDNGHLLYASLAIAFKNYPQLKQDVYARQSTFTSLPPDVVYSKEQVNSFLGLGNVQVPSPASIPATGPVPMMTRTPATGPAPAPEHGSNQ